MTKTSKCYLRGKTWKKYVQFWKTDRTFMWQIDRYHTKPYNLKYLRFTMHPAIIILIYGGIPIQYMTISIDTSSIITEFSLWLSQNQQYQNTYLCSIRRFISAWKSIKTYTKNGLILAWNPNKITIYIY